MTEHPQTSHDAPAEALCPSCGRFVGPYETCPYCGAKQHGRIPVRVVKIAALLLATVGLLALWAIARTAAIPAVTAADAAGTLNMAYVQITGYVARSLSYDPVGGYLAFWVEDGTGEVRVSAYRDVTEELLAAGHIPALGDEVTVAGTLRIREDYVALTLNVPEHLALTRPAPLALKAGELTVLDEGLRVRLTGEVRRILTPYPGMTLITLRDDTGETVIAVSEVITTITGPLPEMAAGQGITVAGTVSLYKDTPQIVPADVADIQVGPRPVVAAAAARALGALSASDAGMLVEVAGRVVRLEGFNGGVKATLDDGQAQVVVLLWDSVYGALESPTALDVGADIVAQGEVSVYQDELEVVPESAGDVRVVNAAPEIAWLEVGALRLTDAGRVVRLRGVLGEPKGFSAGVKVLLNDGTGEITVLLWNNLVTALPQRPAAGQQVEVVGVVEEYRGELELIPRSVLDWRVE